jgi:hypothetical protein
MPSQPHFDSPKIALKNPILDCGFAEFVKDSFNGVVNAWHGTPLLIAPSLSPKPEI